MAALPMVALVQAGSAQEAPADVNSFRLPPAASATTAPPMVAPPPPVVAPTAAPSASPSPTSPSPTSPSPTSSATATPRPRPTVSPRAGTPRPAAAPVVAPTTAPTAAADALPPPTPSANPASSGIPTLDNVPAPPPPLPTDEGRPWLAGGAAIVALGAAALLLRRRRKSAQDEVLEAEAPASSPPPEPSPPAALSPRSEPKAPPPPAPLATPLPEPALSLHDAPPMAARGKAGETLSVVLSARRLSATLMNAALTYELTITNTGAEPIGPIAVSGDMMGAHASIPPKTLLETAADSEPQHRVPRLEPGESAAMSGELRLPLAAITPIRHGTATLFVPLARFRVLVFRDKRPPVSAGHAFVVGEEPANPGAALKPFRLDLGPRLYSSITQRELALPA